MLFLSHIFALARNALKTINPLLVILFFSAVVVMALTAADPIARNILCSNKICFHSPAANFWNSILNTLASGTVLSIIFFWLLVELPNHRKKERLKRTFEKQYRSFKLQCIDIFLVLSGSSNDLELANRLLDVDEFRQFFKQDTGEDQNRWHRFANGLNDYYLDALARKMENLRDEFRVFILAVEPNDDELILLLKRFSESTYYHATRSGDYDDVKSLCGYFWELFAGWSFIEGYRANDSMLEAIRQV